MLEPPDFVPLRTDPPPELGSTLWTRSALALTIEAAAAAIVVADGRGRSGGFGGPVVWLLHGGVAALLLAWTVVAVANVDALVPATRYSAGARSRLAGALWIVAFAVAGASVWVVRRLGSSFAADDAPASTLASTALVAAALVAAWMPFRYLARQAARLGAPGTVMAAWFWLPLATFVAGVQLLALYYRGPAGPGGSGETLGVATVYGLAVAVFGWSTWRAVTVFDEVIDLRWRRWKADWEQTLADMAAQPAPGPERP